MSMIVNDDDGGYSGFRKRIREAIGPSDRIEALGRENTDDELQRLRAVRDERQHRYKKDE